MTLPTETVRRALPALVESTHARLFQHESELRLAPVMTSVCTGDFLPAGWHQDLSGWRGRLKAVWAWVSTRSETYVPGAGRQALIATDRFSNGYFHWVTEVLPRLWWLQDDLGRLELVLPAFAAKYAYMVESLDVFPSLHHRVLPHGVRWSLTDALLAPATAPTGNYRPALVNGVADAWRSRVGARTPFRKVYVSRARALRRRVANEKELSAALEKRDYETVYLEGMRFPDQVRLLAETTDLISNHGAGLTNMMFMLPGTRVTEIRLDGDAHNNCYFSLARARGLDYRYVLAPARKPGEAAHTADLVVPLKAFA